jgi:hypothetical protein
MISVNGGVGVGRYSAVSGGSARVDINGTGVSGFPQLMVSDTTGRQWEFRGVNASASFILDYWNGAGSRTNNLLTISAGGNLGVLGNLTVSGTGTSSVAGVMSAVSGQFTGSQGAASGSGAEVGFFSGGAYVFGYNRSSSASLPLYLQHPGGNVLVGTTTDAGYKLDVNGTARIQSNLTVSGTGSINGASGTAALAIKETASAATALLLTNRNSTQTWGIAVDAAVVDDKQLAFISGGNVVLSLNATTLAATLAGNLTVSGTIAIGNTVNTVSPTSPNRTITMVIGGTTYYLHAKTTND